MAGMDSRGRSLASSNPAHFLKVYFDFGYHLFLHPFRFKDENGECRLCYSLPHQIFCGIMHLLALIRIATPLRKIPVSNILNNSGIYFSLAQSFGSLVYHFIFFRMLWLRRNIFATVIQQMEKIPALVEEKTGYLSKSKTVALSICGLYTVKALLDPILGYKYIPISSWSIRNLFQAYNSEGRYTLFLSNNSSELGSENFSTTDDITMNLSSLEWFQTILIVFVMAVMQIYRELEAHYSDLGLLLCGFTLLWYTTELTHQIRLITSPDPSIMCNNSLTPEVLTFYTSIKLLSRNLNEAIGPVVLMFVLEGIPYYSSHIGDVLVITDWYHRIRFSFFTVQFFIILIVAAEISKRVSILLEWLEFNENYSSLSQSKLMLLLNELNSHPIGLTTNGITTITYKFLTTMVSLIVTYFIIMLQFKASACTCNDEDGINSTRRIVGVMPFMTI